MNTVVDFGNDEPYDKGLNILSVKAQRPYCSEPSVCDGHKIKDLLRY